MIASNRTAEDIAVIDGQWTPETIRRFWEYYGKRQDLHSEYFSYFVGTGLANFLADTARLKPGMSFLDYGCGPGFLVEKLLAKGLLCSGVDGSNEAVERVNRRFQNRDRWMGAITVSNPPAPFPDTSFDVITCVETLEHLLDGRLAVVINEVYRLLKPGGIALFTAPNNEDLLHNHIYCPFCETTFHKVQHVRSFSAESMRELLESQGFKALFCRGIDFQSFQQPWSLPGWRDLNFREMSGWLRKRKNRLLDRIAPRTFPNGRGFQDRVSETVGPNLCALVERPA